MSDTPSHDILLWPHATYTFMPDKSTPMSSYIHLVIMEFEKNEEALYEHRTFDSLYSCLM